MATTFRIAVGTAGFIVPVTVTILDLFGYVAKVEGGSMQPSLNPVDRKSMDYVLLDRWSIRSYKFQRGEVISLSSPVNPDQKIIKRVIGLEGDTVKTLSYKNRIIKIPEGHCWVEGDHHGQSLDSNMFGPVPMGLITSRASHIVWPPSRWRRMALEPSEGRINVSDTSRSRPADIEKDASLENSTDKRINDKTSEKDTSLNNSTEKRPNDKTSKAA